MGGDGYKPLQARHPDAVPAKSVTLYRFDGGGHQLPGRPQVLPGLLGLGSLQINAAETAMDMFAR